MIRRKVVHFTKQWLETLPRAPDEGELIVCPACLGKHPFIYEHGHPTEKSWGYVGCECEYVLAVVEGRVLADTPLQIEEE
jgi:hypothetical protein